MTTALLHTPLQNFAAAVTNKMALPTQGAPEDQLRAPLENFLVEAGRALSSELACKGETTLPDRLGRPDYALHRDNLLIGYLELKPPGTGANAQKFSGRNKQQFERFKALPNLLYTDGNEWTLYQNGKRAGKIVQLSGDVSTDGKKAASPQDALGIEGLLRKFLMWEPLFPRDQKGKIDLGAFAELLAPLCRMLRKDVEEALEQPHSPLIQLKKDWKQLLFPEASDEQFADAYAQTVLFALLLGRSEGADPLTLEAAQSRLATQHGLLARALTVLTDADVRREIDSSLDLLLRVIAVVPPATLSETVDPWLYFYEDFLAVYDIKLRKKTGVYYTPVEVVHAQVRFVSHLLSKKYGKRLGFADPEVITLDPAVGTGTYLLGIIEHALGHVEKIQGFGAVAGVATTLARNLHGFETLVGPYAVSEMRVSDALRNRGAQLPKEGPRIYLTDTLESPYADPPQSLLFHRLLADQHKKALEVKSRIPVIVCLGNPPYGRHDAATATNRAATGGWIRYGDAGGDPILDDFLGPVRAAGQGGHLKNIYNLYVYFWRWALWKVFEQGESSGPGIVSYISASSYLDGPAFGGMREHMRRQCDQIYILDLGGEGRGPRKSENVFAIQTPVAIAIALRTKEAETKTPAQVFFHRLEGTRAEKLAQLDEIDSPVGIEWQSCPNDWNAPFLPAGEGAFFDWPLLTDLMPWQRSGVMAGRTWVVAPQKETLSHRWRTLLHAEGEERTYLFKESPTGRKAHTEVKQLPPTDSKLTSISRLTREAPAPDIVRFAYRSFDRQFFFSDARLLDRPGPPLWRAHGERQTYITSLLTKPMGSGPALTVCSEVPERDYFSGRGAKDVIPIFRVSDATQPNILPGLLELLGDVFRQPVTPDDFVSYLYGISAHPEFTWQFAIELETRELRVPLTKDAALFERARAIGARLIWLHTYGERFVPEGKSQGIIPFGKAKCIVAVPTDAQHYPEDYAYESATGTLHVGQGEFSPVSPEIYEFEISGLKVVQSWLSYRMKKGKKEGSSPLDKIRPTTWTDQFTTELLELLWVLKATLESYPAQAELLHQVIAGDCFRADELPEVPEEMRKEPAQEKLKRTLFDQDDVS